MSKFKWDQFGEDMAKSVQDAIDKKDFSKLNETISSTVNEAMDVVSQSLKSVNQGTKSIKTTKPQPVVMTTEQLMQQHLSAKSSQYFRNVYATRIGGILLAILGFGLTGFFVFLITSSPAIVRFIGIHGLTVGHVLIFLVPITLLALGSAIFGLAFQAPARRFRQYVKALDNRKYIEFEELSTILNKRTKFLIKDTKKMIQRGWFKEGHIDHDETYLMITHEVYEAYEKLQEETRKKQAEEEAERKHLAPEIQETIDTGKDYIEQIRIYNTNIKCVEISEKISRIELLLERIFSRVKEAPETAKDTRRLIHYYLPTTIKLLGAYEELSKQVVQGDNIQKSKKEIEDTLDTLNTAFEKLLNDMYQFKAMDVSSDISALNMMLAQEGLTKSMQETINLGDEV